MNDIQLQLAAREYAQKIIFTVNFNIGEGSPEEMDHIYSPIHDALVAAFIAGYRTATTEPKGAA